ncbi:26776_t:CDS:1, partial [Gigaspora margarita]
MAKINATTISLDHNEIEATDNMSFELTDIEPSNIMSFELIERETTDTMSFELTKKDVVNNPLDEITNIKTNEFALQTSETAKARRNRLARE